MRGKSPEETAMDLVIEDDSRVGTVYFLMSEDNVKQQIALPWVSFGSDAGVAGARRRRSSSPAPHPRAYGNFARLLGKYVRDEKLIPLEEAIRRLTSLPGREPQASATAAGSSRATSPTSWSSTRRRSRTTPPSRSRTSTRPACAHVFVNGVQVLRDGEHTGATPGRVVRGKGYKAKAAAASAGGS